MSDLVHVLSVDVEDWNNAAVLWMTGRIVPPTDDVVRNTMKLLGIFDEYAVKATWFVLGEVAEHFPQLVRTIAQEGHELAIHGYHHHRIHELGPGAFLESVVRAKALVEDITGCRVRGYRAVAMSLTQTTLWAYNAIADAGFEYSSSQFPTRFSRYGISGAPLSAHWIETGTGLRVLEIPLTVVSFAGIRFPAGGGGYLRHLPLWWNLWAMAKLQRERRPAVVYLHPYELDVGAQVRGLPEDLSGDERRRIERLVPGQFRNRKNTEFKLRRLLGRYQFAPLGSVFGEFLQSRQTAG